MYRQIIGYIPSNIVPAVVSTLMIYAYTRLLSPAAFGAYSYVFAIVQVLQTSLFFAVPIAVMRFHTGAVRDGREAGFLKECYIVFYVMSLAAILLGVAASYWIDLAEPYRLTVWLGIPLLLVRSLVLLNQCVSRSANAMARYNAIECAHAVLGFVLGLVAIYFIGPNAGAIIVGLLVAAVLCALPDIRLAISPLRRAAGALDREHLLRLIDYAWPLVAVAATGMIMQNGDRFLLGSMSGVETLGIFAVAYSLVDRPMSIICGSISTATFPLVVQVLEHQGKEAARLQAGRNGIALLAVSLPACAGLAMTADYLAATLVGPAFREGTAVLIPIMSFTALARGLRGHFIDHAFHLSGRPLMMLWTYVPATILNIGLNLLVIPRYGMMGAAWTALASHVVVVVGGWFIGTSIFPVWLPFWPVIRCVLAVVPMVVALGLVHFPLNWTGLAAAISLGAALYTVSALVLDVGEVRSLGLAAFRHRVGRSTPALTKP